MTYKENAADLLNAYDCLVSGKRTSVQQWELQEAVALAGCFAAAAYDVAPKGGNEIHALIRSFLLALIDPTSEELDYLRADPSSGAALREATAKQSPATRD